MYVCNSPYKLYQNYLGDFSTFFLLRKRGMKIFQNFTDFSLFVAVPRGVSSKILKNLYRKSFITQIGNENVNFFIVFFSLVLVIHHTLSRN